MTERKAFSIADLLRLPKNPSPTIWPDSDNQADVFRQSRNLPKRQHILEEDSFRMNQDVDFYRCEYEYGYLDKKKRKGEKYIKKSIQSLEDPQLQVEQLLYRTSQLSKNCFVCSTRIVDGKRTKHFVESQYNGINYHSGNISLYPYCVENEQEEIIAAISNHDEQLQQFEHIQDAINNGESLLKFIHQGRLGRYSVYVPLMLNEIVTHDLFKYFNNPKLPEIEDYVIMPEELDFYIELESS